MTIERSGAESFIPRAFEPVVTYSPAQTIVPTYECFNRCHYCNFRVEPGGDRWLSLGAAETVLRSLTQNFTDRYNSASTISARAAAALSSADPIAGPIELLILSGEVHPRSTRRSVWLSRIESLGRLGLLFGMLPHTNAGPLDRAEMERLKAVNVSMGLMIEQVSPRLMQTVHRHAPSKHPDLRLAQLAQAGELRIPFTTGLLIGIGETRDDRVATLRAIAQIQRQHGHIQEVIIQPHSPGESQDWEGEPCDAETLLETLAIARDLLPDEVALQVPPNLLRTAELIQRAIALGARDLGGICPIDEVNPTYDHPSLAQLTQWVAAVGGRLRPRLPIYPAFDDWLAEPLRSLVQDWRNRLQPASQTTRPTARPTMQGC